MRRHDLAWRSLGAAIVAAASVLKFSRYGDATAMPAFCFGLLGILLMIQGRRVVAALRVELGRHRLLARIRRRA
ncbi:hypothetical protein [Glacieibacterium sp.]|uniref:hypothetical protein n=1 Tax=Glacieibacterium sp. TaxID=2860237 RepID=UPI003B002BE5